jgi:hypothetical protein
VAPQPRRSSQCTAVSCSRSRALRRQVRPWSVNPGLLDPLSPFPFLLSLIRSSLPPSFLVAHFPNLILSALFCSVLPFHFAVSCALLWGCVFAESGPLVLSGGQDGVLVAMHEDGTLVSRLSVTRPSRTFLTRISCLLCADCALTECCVSSACVCGVCGCVRVCARM